MCVVDLQLGLLHRPLHINDQIVLVSARKVCLQTTLATTCQVLTPLHSVAVVVVVSLFLKFVTQPLLFSLAFTCCKHLRAEHFNFRQQIIHTGTQLNHRWFLVSISVKLLFQF